MILPRLTFFCELESEDLKMLFAEVSVVEDLLDLKANLSLGIIDLSSQRAEVVQRLNEAGIPVVARLLLPLEHGYWFNVGNAPQTTAFYQEFKSWTSAHGLRWAAIGLDIKPDIRDLRQIATNKWSLLPTLLRRAFDRKRLAHAQTVFSDLVAQIHADGYSVESYQIPIIADERKIGSTFLRRITGLVDIQVDREVWMLYTSFLQPHGAGYLWSYAPEAQSIGLGSTGGGVDTGIIESGPLKWDELARDLRLAWYWCNDLYIFSLEGCVHQGYLERLKTFEWDQPILFPDEVAERFKKWRKVLRLNLWVVSNGTVILVGMMIILLLIKGLLRLDRTNK